MFSIKGSIYIAKISYTISKSKQRNFWNFNHQKNFFIEIVKTIRLNVLLSSECLLLIGLKPTKTINLLLHHHSYYHRLHNCFHHLHNCLLLLLRTQSEYYAYQHVLLRSRCCEYYGCCYNHCGDCLQVHFGGCWQVRYGGCCYGHCG